MSETAATHGKHLVTSVEQRGRTVSLHLETLEQAADFKEDFLKNLSTANGLMNAICEAVAKGMADGVVGGKRSAGKVESVSGINLDDAQLSELDAEIGQHLIEAMGAGLNKAIADTETMHRDLRELIDTWPPAPEWMHRG